MQDQSRYSCCMPTNQKVFDLEERFTIFTRDVRDFVHALPLTIANKEYIPQVIRSSGSIGANYIEANDALGKKDFRLKIRTSRREAKETRYWISLLQTYNICDLEGQRAKLIDEAGQCIRILSSIAQKADS